MIDYLIYSNLENKEDISINFFKDFYKNLPNESFKRLKVDDINICLLCNIDTKEVFYEDEDYFCLVDFDHKREKYNNKLVSKLFLKYFLANKLDKFTDISNAYSFIIYKKKSKIIIIGSDHMSLKQSFHMFKEKSFIISSRLSFISIPFSLDLTLNEKRVRDFLNFSIKSRSYTFFNEIKKLAPRTILEFNRNNHALRARKYIDFLKIKRNKKMKTSTASNNFMHYISSNIRSAVSKRKKIGVLFSGGLDSSSILKISSETKNTDQQLFSFSATYSSLGTKIDESKFQDSVINEIENITPVKFDGSKYSSIDNIDFYLDQIGEPFFFPNIYLSYKAFKLANEEGIDLLLNGNDGDTVISHGYEYIKELFYNFKWITLFLNLWHLSKKRKKPFFFVVKRLIINDIIKNKHSEYSANDATKMHAQIISSKLHADSIEKQTAIAKFFNIQESYPFYDFHVIEHSISAPPQFKLNKGVSRFYLRNAMRDLLPKENVNRLTKSNLTHALIANIAGKNRTYINDQLNKPHPLLNQAMDLIKLQKEFSILVNAPKKYAVRSQVPSKIFAFVVLNTWLNKYFK